MHHQPITEGLSPEAAAMLAGELTALEYDAIRLADDIAYHRCNWLACRRSGLIVMTESHLSEARKAVKKLRRTRAMMGMN